MKIIHTDNVSDYRVQGISENLHLKIKSLVILESEHKKENGKLEMFPLFLRKNGYILIDFPRLNDYTYVRNSREGVQSLSIVVFSSRLREELSALLTMHLL